MKHFLAILGTTLALLGQIAATPAQAADKVTFGTNWLAEAEHAAIIRLSLTAPTPNMASR